MIKVMIAEDQEIIRQSLEFMLNERPGIDVICVSTTGAETIEKAKKYKPDLILMDIRMPEIDGVECTRIIKNIIPDTKILILTTFEDDEYIYDAMKHGANGYILKGISVEKLVFTIKEVNKGGVMLEPSVAAKVVNRFSQYAQGDMVQRADEEDFKNVSPTELKIMQLIGKGFSVKEITEILYLSQGTVRNYISSILSKLNLKRQNADCNFCCTKRNY